jgi:GTP-binding protein EngB required for normal cell division
MLDAYTAYHQKTKEALKQLLGYAAASQNAAFSTSLEKIFKKLVDNRFYLVVLGQFKRGKSTFINSLIGDKLLPTSIVPLTSIVTVLRFGDRPKIEVLFKDGTRREIDRGTLTEYVTEKGNPKNVKSVDHVEISYPSEYLKQGVHIIDTPGVGSIFANNTEITYDFLPRVDAALFLLAGDPPISEAEQAFLKDIRKFVDKIFFIQNKVDYLDEEECEESMAFSKLVIEETLGRNSVIIHPLSAKKALLGKMRGDESLLRESFLPGFETVLNNFLMKEKGKVFLTSVLKGIEKLLNDETVSLKIELKAIATPVKDLEEKIALFEKQLETIQAEKRDNGYFFEAEAKRLIDRVDYEVRELKERQFPTLLKELEKTADEKEGLDVKAYIRELEKTLNERIVHAFDEWITLQEKILNKEYAHISKKFSDRTNEIIDSLLEASAQLFGIQLERISSDEAIKEERRFYYLMGDRPKFFDLEGAIDFFSRSVLPKGLSRGHARKKVLKKLPERIDANCGRVKADFTLRIRESFMSFRYELNQKIDKTAASIREALKRAMRLKTVNMEEVKKRENILARQLEEVNGYHTTINFLLGEIGCGLNGESEE